MPWSDGADHKRQMAKLRFMAPFISVQRDHGSGEVVIDDLGRAVVRWGLDDPVDRRVAVRANVELARLHHAAGAAEIFTLHADRVGLAARRGLRRVPGRDRAGALRPARHRLLHGAPDGRLPDGAGPGDVGRRRARRAARHEGRLDRRRVGVPDRAGGQPDDLDHVARPPHRGPRGGFAAGLAEDRSGIRARHARLERCG